LWFCRHDDAALRPFARGLDPATFRSWGFELGSRSHLHSEEWMCFFEPDASFRDLQRLTASHGHVPACPILAHREGLPRRCSWWCGCPFERPQHLPCDRYVRTHQTTAARRAVFLPDDQARDPVPKGPKGLRPPTLSHWRHDSRACRSTASKGEEGAQADFGPLVRPERSTPKDVDPFVTSPATACAVQSILDSLPSPSCRA
jgi:hypothetical protein